MSVGQRRELLFTATLPGVGAYELKVDLGESETRTDSMVLTELSRIAIEHEGGWLSVQEDVGPFSSDRWRPVRINLNHFAMLAAHS